jgi:optic atrophy 3 protein
MAQTIHRIDMRLKLGLLRDTAAIEERAAKEAAEAAARRHRSKVPTAKTEAEIQAEKAETEEAKKKAIEEVKAKPLPRIRPLSESKAIDSGANFISETFLFLVAGGLIVFESWRSRRKETSRRSDVQDRLVELEESEKAARRALGILEKELLELKAQQSKLPAKHMKRILPQEVWEEDTQEVAPKQEDQGWLAQIRSYFPSSSTTPAPSVQVAPPPPATKKEESSLASTTTDSPHSIIPTLLKPGHSSPSPKES